MSSKSVDRTSTRKEMKEHDLKPCPFGRYHLRKVRNHNPNCDACKGVGMVPLSYKWRSKA